MTYRIIDLLFSSFFFIILLPFLILVGLLIKLETRGPIIHWSKRIGINQTIFLMPKFRSMKINTPDVATHLMKNPDLYVTKFGKFIRKYSIDELPQLYSIIKGDISFIGPRPALFNQYDLMKLRKEYGIDKIKPGLTGYAQVMGRDNLSIEKKVRFEKFYADNKNFFLDLKIIILTLQKIIKTTNVTH